MSSTLTIKLVDNSTVVHTATGSTSNVGGEQVAQNIIKRGIFFDDVGVAHPVSAIVSITIT